MEVVYAGLHLPPEQVAQVAVDEDVDVVGVSILSGAHLTLVPLLIAGLRNLDAPDVPVVCGGVIPDDDIAELTSAGVAAVVDQEIPLDEVVEVVRNVVATSRGTGS
jgi:methylmalonyl-CoA mutase C-terminal domain/subunit